MSRHRPIPSQVLVTTTPASFKSMRKTFPCFAHIPPENMIERSCFQVVYVRSTDASIKHIHHGAWMSKINSTYEMKGSMFTEKVGRPQMPPPPTALIYMQCALVGCMIIPHSSLSGFTFCIQYLNVSQTLPYSYTLSSGYMQCKLIPKQIAWS